MYGNPRYEQGAKVSDTGLPSLSWRAQTLGESNGNVRADIRQQPVNCFNGDKGANLSWRTTELGRRFEDMKEGRTDWYSANSEQRYNDTAGSRLSWHAAQSGAALNSTLENSRPRPLLDSTKADIQANTATDSARRFEDVKVARPDWYAANSDERSNDATGSRLSWRAAQSGMTNVPSLDQSRPKPLLDSGIHFEAERTDWYSANTVATGNPPTEISRPKSLLEQRYNDVDGARLSWRASQSGAASIPQPEPHPKSLLDNIINELDRRFVDKTEARPDWYSMNSDPKNGVQSDARQQSTENRLKDDISSNLSWRTTELGRRFEDIKAARSDQYPINPVASDIPSLETSRPKPLLDEPYNNVEKPRLSWRSIQSALAATNVPPLESSQPKPLLAPNDGVQADTRQQYTAAENRLKDDNVPNLSWRKTVAVSETSRPKPLLGEADVESIRLSWRAAQSGIPASEPSRSTVAVAVADRSNNTLAAAPGVLGERYNSAKLSELSWRSANPISRNEAPVAPQATVARDVRYNDINNAGGLSWRSGAGDLNPPKPLLPIEGPDKAFNGNMGPLSWREASTGGSQLGKTRYSDMYPEDKFGPSREAFADRSRFAAYPAKAYY